MGADLYVRGIDVPTFGFEVSEKAGKAGYFRDCYNSHGLFAKIKLSWWQLVGEYEEAGKIVEIDDTTLLKPDHVREFSDTVEAAFEKSKVKGKKDYKEWMAVFRLFIARAEEVGEGIEFSV